MDEMNETDQTDLLNESNQINEIQGVLRIEEGAYVFEDVFFGRWVERIGVRA